MDYDYKDYWSNLHARGGLSAVGQSSMSENINTWIYRTRARNLRRFARAHQLDKGGRVLEVGVGTGFWLPMWKSLGFEVHGCDLVEEAAARVQSAHPDGRFWQADLSSEKGLADPAGGSPADGYDLVTAIDVLLHVTDDEAFQRALENLTQMVRPGGHLLLIEPAIVTKKKLPPYNPVHSSRARLLRWYRRPLRELGFQLVTKQATTVLACNPIEATSVKRLRAYQRWWQVVRGASEHPWRARFVGPAMYVGDRVLLRAGEAPTSKILLFRREPTAASS